MNTFLKKLMVFSSIFLVCVLCSCKGNSDTAYETAQKAYAKGSYTIAFKYFLKSGKNGNKMAQNTLGYMYLKGQGIEKDEKVAFQWYQKAAIQGVSDAEYMMGYLLFKGIGTEKSTKKALSWFKKAYSQKDKRANVYLVKIYSEGGDGVAKNYEKTLAHILISNYKDNPSLLYRLSILYENGWGVNKNLKKAEGLLREAIALNKKDSIVAKGALAEFLLTHKNKFDEADELIIELNKRFPDNPQIIHLKGWLKLRQKKYNESLEQLKKASELAPDNDEIIDHLGDVYQALGKTKEAKEQWQKALELTKDKELKKKIEEKLDLSPSKKSSD